MPRSGQQAGWVSLGEAASEGMVTKAVMENGEAGSLGCFRLVSADSANLSCAQGHDGIQGRSYAQEFASLLPHGCIAGRPRSARENISAPQ